MGVNYSIFVIDVKNEKEFCYSSLNPFHEEITGFSTENIRGKKPEDVLPKDIANECI